MISPEVTFDSGCDVPPCTEFMYLFHHLSSPSFSLSHYPPLSLSPSALWRGPTLFNPICGGSLTERMLGKQTGPLMSGAPEGARWGSMCVSVCVCVCVCVCLSGCVCVNV